MLAKYVHELDDAAFQGSINQAARPVLVDFWAPWCPPCRALAPTIEAIAEQFEGRADVANLDIDQNPETAAAYGIRSIPTVLIFRSGQLVDRIAGVQPRARYEQALEAAGAADRDFSRQARDQNRPPQGGPGSAHCPCVHGADLRALRLPEVVRIRGPDADPLHPERPADVLDVPGFRPPRGDLVPGCVGMADRGAPGLGVLESQGGRARCHPLRRHVCHDGHHHPSASGLNRVGPDGRHGELGRYRRPGSPSRGSPALPAELRRGLGAGASGS
jgi:thioredoxin 1